ncbi:hypothetical protein K488DRAFT_79111 [Vararia minispora EC-137]|uniref:Uncharacterized protein n=1 Tax=Vararia minispora EC-137 TaxID=1314806 RepID=A0ACB8QJ64_9AGAM|nr:hypothetical protein K488DRAFT_79111 [Vararia minispora EC-137]
MPAIPPLPLFPSSRARASLSPSQLAILYAKISIALRDVLALSPQKRDTASAIAFVTSYVRNVAQDALTELIWDASSYPGKSELQEARSIRARVLQLAEHLAASGVLPLRTLLDFTVAYAPQSSRVKGSLAQAFIANPSLLAELTSSAVPAFRDVLSPSSSTGLYSLRKTAQCLLCFIRPAPLEVKLAFAHDTTFMLSLARVYDGGLAVIAHSYGGLRLDARNGRELDEWERLILETKVALIDTFHVLLKAVFDSLARSDGAARAAEADRAFSTLFALQDLQPHVPTSSASATPTSYLNRPLLADYQTAHNLSRLVERTLARAEANDARAELLMESLRALDDRSTGQGALTLLFGSGVPHSIDNRGDKQVRAVRGAEASSAPVAGNSAVMEAQDAQVSEVLGILPDYPRDYIRALLLRPEFGTVERVVEALLEGTAPPAEQLQPTTQIPQDEFEFTRDRVNVFDGEEMDLSRVHVGKKRRVDISPSSDDVAKLLSDRSFVQQMKSDILRRAEADEDNDSDDDEAAVLAEVFGKPAEEGKVREVAFEEELDALDLVPVVGDGEDTDEASDEDVLQAKMDVYTVLELAYIANPEVFKRDAATRRGKERAALRARTGWVDEQIEGWRVMLERDPKQKEKILAKHEFHGNQPSLPSSTQPSSGEPSRSGTPSRGASRGHIRGHSRGRGGSSGGGNSSHARKGKHKASQANHDRKKGHDKKMQRAGALG